MGKFCSIIDYCLVELCINNGICVLELFGYVCYCYVGFDGKNCECDMDECVFNLCLVRLVCYDNVGGFICVWKDN